MFLLMNYFCGMVDGSKALSLISTWEHCWNFSPSQASDTPRAWFELAQILGSDFVEWKCPVIIATSPRCLVITNLLSIVPFTLKFLTRQLYFQKRVRKSYLSIFKKQCLPNGVLFYSRKSKIASIANLFIRLKHF